MKSDPLNVLKLLGVCIETNKLRFDEHINSISKKSRQQLGILKRLEGGDA